jgi:hypothetical protein
MQCDEFERRLHQVLDGRGLAEDDLPLRRHAATCPACRGTLASQRALWAGLAGLQTPELAEGFAEAVVRESMYAKPQAGTLLRQGALAGDAGRVLAAAAVAALLVIAPAIYFVFGWSANSPSPAPDVAREQRQPDEVSPPLPEPPLLADSASSSREEQYAELLDRWRVQITVTGDRLGLTGEDAPTVQGAAAVSQLTDRLRSPLAASIESTLNVLRTALPSSHAESSPSKPQAGLIGIRVQHVS